jgi:hypothetical protein
MVAQSIIDEQRREFGIQPEFRTTTGAVAAIDTSKGLVHQNVLTNNVFFTEPINPPLVGEFIRLILIQDSVGSHSVSWGICFRDAPSWAPGAANSRASAIFMYDGAGYQYIDGSSAFAVNGLQLVPATGSALVAGGALNVLTNPAPTVAAMSLAGVAPTLTANTVVTRTPTVGALTAAGVAPLVSVILTPPAASLGLLGQVPTRSP